MSEHDGPAVRAFRPRFAASDAVDESVGSRMISRIFKNGPGSSRVDSGMIIGAADKRFDPGDISLCGNAVFKREPFNELRIQTSQESGRELIHRFCPGAIPNLEGVAKQYCLFNVFDR